MTGKVDIRLSKIARVVIQRVQSGDDLWEILDEISLPYVNFPKFLELYTRQAMLQFADGLEETLHAIREGVINNVS